MIFVLRTDRLMITKKTGKPRSNLQYMQNYNVYSNY